MSFFFRGQDRLLAIEVAQLYHIPDLSDVKGPDHLTVEFDSFREKLVTLTFKFCVYHLCSACEDKQSIKPRC